MRTFNGMKVLISRSVNASCLSFLPCTWDGSNQLINELSGLRSCICSVRSDVWDIGDVHKGVES